jgi:hypothetical protein
MKKIFEFDLLICPKCAGTMKIKAFISDSKKIDQILKQLDYPNQRAPPKLRSSLSWEDYIEISVLRLHDVSVLTDSRAKTRFWMGSPSAMAQS